MFVNKQVQIPLLFNGYPVPFMAKICKIAQNILNEDDPKAYNPTPFVKKNDVGCEAVFRSQSMANKVEEIMENVSTKEFPVSSYRAIEICFHMAIEEDESENFIYFIEENTFFICHPEEGHAEHICEKMMEFFKRHILPHPIVLVSDLIDICSVPLKEDERLIISCGLSTLLIPMADKEEEFFKEFRVKIDRLKEMEVECNGILFASMKQICSEIDVKGVFYFITPTHVKLTGLPHHLKNFSEILKRRIKERVKDQQTNFRVLSRK